MVVNALILAAVTFSRSLVGIVFVPYATYRRLVQRANLWELVYLGTILALYFALASVVKTASFRPFLLTRQFVLLAAAVGLSFAFSVEVLWWAAKAAGGRGRLAGLTMAWAYSLVPTLVWFLTTSLLYVILPPPRTTSPWGIGFSVLYLIFSTTLLFWKATLAYLALRFGMRLDLKQIVLVAAVALPGWALYSVAMYRMGIFRVPFL